MSDYHCNLLPSSSHSSSSINTTPYPLSSIISYDKFTPTSRSYIISYTLETEPKTFKQAMASEKLTKAVNVELHALEDKGTWKVESLPLGKNVVGCKWIFTIKYNVDGTTERYKARLVS